MGSGTLLVTLVAWPFLAALAVPWLGRRDERLRDGWVLGATLLALAGAAWLAVRVTSGQAPVTSVPLLVGRLGFQADAFSALFALFSTFVWCCATLYSLAYMQTQQRRDRYHAASLVVLGAKLGVVLAADLVTLFLFFETLGLVAFLLVVHTGTPEARSAAIQYFWMTILGGVALLSGIMMVYAMGGGAVVAGIADDGTALRTAAAALMVLGFGVKAGMVPVHFWLPNAHPVAPTPASALLSGVMIKAGAYGIFRSLSAVFGPGGAPEAAFATQFGLVMTWMGIITMAVGVVMALGQANAKRMLAYHSISQMGFILAGLGAGAFLLGEGAMGTAGGLLHAVNHALFKASLFLGVGAVAFRAGSLDMYALGGLWRRMPWTFALMLIAAAGIAGLPLFNGFVSKSMIHHALEAAHADSGGRWLQLAERIFILTAAGTAASFIKLTGLVFLGRSKLENLAEVQEAPAAMLVAMGLLSVPIVVLGLWPGLLLEGLLAPGLAAAGVPPDGVPYYLERYFLSRGDVLMSLGIIALGGLVFAVGMRFGLFHLHLPAWLGPAFWIQRAGAGILALFGLAARMMSARRAHSAERAAAMAHGMATGRTTARHPAQPAPGGSTRPGRPAQQFLAAIQGISHGYAEAQRQGSSALGALFLAVFQGITLVYGYLQYRVAWLLRAVRRRFLLGLGSAGLARQALVDSLLTTPQDSPAQAVLETAWAALEQERHATVRQAVAKAAAAPGDEGLLEEEAHEAMVESTRALSALMAGAVFEARLELLRGVARERDADAVRAAFAALHRQFAETRAAVCAATEELALARSRGEDIVRAVSAALAPLGQREAHAVAEAGGLPAEAASALLPPTPRVRPVRRRREAVRAWVRDLARLLVLELRQHPSTWPQSESLDTDPRMVSARRGIQRYARDVALNVASIFLLMALFAAVLWLAG